MHRRSLAALPLLASLAWSAFAADVSRLPNLPDSLKFAVLGDMGTGGRAQYEIAHQMAQAHEQFAFEMVIMLGDNMYGSQRPLDFVRKFERPYAPLLAKGVLFHASLGNHDKTTNRYYEPWNMNGERYYTFQKKNVRFFALDSTSFDPRQRSWLERELQSDAPWKVAYFHHPLYSSAGRHGSQVDLRRMLEPLLIKYGVNVVFSGHDHVYERIKPQNGVSYFVAGSGGKLRRGDLERSPLTAVGYDRTQSFMLVEVDGNVMSFQAVNRAGIVVDSGGIDRRNGAVNAAP